jgi:hypothetical protein
MKGDRSAKMLMRVPRRPRKRESWGKEGIAARCLISIVMVASAARRQPADIYSRAVISTPTLHGTALH